MLRAVPGHVVAPDRVMVGDRAAGRDERVGRVFRTRRTAGPAAARGERPRVPAMRISSPLRQARKSLRACRPRRGHDDKGRSAGPDSAPSPFRRRARPRDRRRCPSPGTVGCRSAPADAPHGLIDLREQRVLVAKVEPDAGKIRLLACEITLRGVDRRGDFRRGPARLRFRRSAQQARLSADSALVAGNWKRTTPNSLHAIAQKPAVVSKME